MIYKQNLFGLYAITKRVFVYELTSIRMLILVVVFGFTVIASAYGFAVLPQHPALIPQDIENVIKYGADAIVYLSAMFIAFIGSITAIGISFDCIVKEKITHSIDLLLSRPVSLMVIILGNFIGICLAIFVPVFVILIISISVVGLTTGSFPSITMSIGFIILTFLFLSSFVAIQLIFSSIAKSSANSLMFGILIWLIFTFFWSLLSMSIAYISGISTENMLASTEYNLIRSKVDLLSPVGAYDISLGMLIHHGGITAAGIPIWLPFVSLILWVFIPFLVSVKIFKRKCI